MDDDELDALELNSLFDRTTRPVEFDEIARVIGKWCSEPKDLPLENFGLHFQNDPEFQQIVFQISKWFPPIYPQYSGALLVTNESPLHEKLIVQYFAECFQREMAIAYGKPRLQRQFDAVGSGETQSAYEAWISLLQDCSIAQIALFSEDAPEHLRAAHGMNWVLSWVWTNPKSRRRGTFSKGWPKFEEKYGKFFIRKPLSPGAQRVIAKNNVEDYRLID